MATAQPGFPPHWKSLMDIKWVPGGGPSAIQATVIHRCGDLSLILRHVYKMLLLKPLSMVKRLLLIFLVKSIILIHYFDRDKLRNCAFTGKRKQSCSSLSPQVIALDPILQARSQGGSSGAHQAWPAPGRHSCRRQPFC